jgi:hypothetical protein
MLRLHHERDHSNDSDTLDLRPMNLSCSRLVPGQLGHFVQPGSTVVCAASGGSDWDAGICL